MIRIDIMIDGIQAEKLNGAVKAGYTKASIIRLALQRLFSSDLYAEMVNQKPENKVEGEKCLE